MKEVEDERLRGERSRLGDKNEGLGLGPGTEDLGTEDLDTEDLGTEDLGPRT